MDCSSLFFYPFSASLFLFLGESVPVGEQTSLSVSRASAATASAVSSMDTLSGETSSLMSPSAPGTPAIGASVTAPAMSSEERTKFEEERARLYAEMDEKVRSKSP